MLIPIGHENLRGRRWPYISIAIIALNVLAFLGTHWTIEVQSAETGEVESHILMMAGAHPDLKMTTEAQRFVDGFMQSNPKVAASLRSGNREVEDAWDARMRLVEDPAALQSEMDGLCQQYSEKVEGSLLHNYGYVPAAPHAASYLTSMFLHGGWMHLIFNMWFLWLARSWKTPGAVPSIRPSICSAVCWPPWSTESPALAAPFQPLALPAPSPD